MSRLVWILLFARFLASATEVAEIVSEPGKTVTLPCQVVSSSPVIAIEWTRPNLGAEYILLYRDGQFDPENQHPLFKDRVALQERSASLTLKNVTEDDRGRYECHVIQRRQRQKRSSTNSEQVQIINLTVQREAPLGPMVAALAGVCVIAGAAAVALVILRRRRLSQQRPVPGVECNLVELQLMQPEPSPA